MDKVTEARLRLIKARADALGWICETITFRERPIEIQLRSTVFTCGFKLCKTGLQAAERLLACYEKGTIYNIKHEVAKTNYKKVDGVFTPDIKTICSSKCDFFAPVDCYDCGGLDCAMDWNIEYAVPGPDCPGAGTYKLVEVDDGAV